jgi:hypothetical protein
MEVSGEPIALGGSAQRLSTRFDDPGIESPWTRDFPHACSPAVMVHPASETLGSSSFPEIKRPGLCANHLPHLAPMLMKE